MLNNSPQLQSQIESIIRQVIDEMVPSTNPKIVPIGISARHLHIKQEHLEILFGPGYQLTKLKDLIEPGEFAANETVALIGPNRRSFPKIRILGPTRPETQVELSFTDGIFLGMQVPHRMSGDIKGSAPLTLVGPAGVLNLPEGGIRAMRHIHISPQDAERMGVKNGQAVSIKTNGPASVNFNNTIIRVKEGLILQMHVDTDEANAAGLTGSTTIGEIII